MAGDIRALAGGPEARALGLALGLAFLNQVGGWVGGWVRGWAMGCHCHKRIGGRAGLQGWE